MIPDIKFALYLKALVGCFVVNASSPEAAAKLLHMMLLVDEPKAGKATSWVELLASNSNPLPDHAFGDSFPLGPVHRNMEIALGYRFRDHIILVTAMLTMASNERDG